MLTVGLRLRPVQFNVDSRKQDYSVQLSVLQVHIHRPQDETIRSVSKTSSAWRNEHILRINTRLQKQENLQSRSTSVEMRYSGFYAYEPINLQAALTQRMETEADIRSH